MKQVYKEVRFSIAMNVPKPSERVMAQESYELIILSRMIEQLEKLANEQREDVGLIRVDFEGWKDL